MYTHITTPIHIMLLNIHIDNGIGNIFVILIYMVKGKMVNLRLINIPQDNTISLNYFCNKLFNFAVIILNFIKYNFFSKNFSILNGISKV